ncbi:hypothetical protein CF70_017980 [Cupriavidus sp. SK-3]|uniref:hypothetical protein n=1 Tax=Cupriavidus sp. SK-3 TaxID=1470558 RepID=UPI0004537766|nr:hypothetical protein [Cupriavidus sp. SK-3]KDP84707.1 hypothetical protein CF70_017980 [Cupriavidus sp. SK-3]
MMTTTAGDDASADEGLPAAQAGVPLDSEIAIGTDEYAGVGGSFVFDPATGRRTPTAGPALEIATRPDNPSKE